MTTQLSFRSTQFNAVSRHNSIYLTAVEIAQALGYKKSDAVTQIYERNSDEFSADMSETLNLSVSGNYQKTVRIFSLRGAHLIAMFARTPVAKEFRRWVLDILDREVGQPTPSAEWRPAEVHAFCDNHANRTEIIYYQDFKPLFCRVLRSDEMVIAAEDHIEMMERLGYLAIHCDEFDSLTLPELTKRADAARVSMKLWSVPALEAGLV